jgi:hypothetical protein
MRSAAEGPVRAWPVLACAAAGQAPVLLMDGLCIDLQLSPSALLAAALVGRRAAPGLPGRAPAAQRPRTSAQQQPRPRRAALPYCRKYCRTAALPGKRHGWSGCSARGAGYGCARCACGRARGRGGGGGARAHAADVGRAGRRAELQVREGGWHRAQGPASPPASRHPHRPTRAHTTPLACSASPHAHPRLAASASSS